MRFRKRKNFNGGDQKYFECGMERAVPSRRTHSPSRTSSDLHRSDVDESDSLGIVLQDCQDSRLSWDHIYFLWSNVFCDEPPEQGGRNVCMYSGLSSSHSLLPGPTVGSGKSLQRRPVPSYPLPFKWSGDGCVVCTRLLMK